MKNIELTILIAAVHVVKITVEDTSFTIYHTGDLHGHFTTKSKAGGGVDRIITYLRREMAEDNSSIYLDAGDIFTGTIWFSVHRHKMAADFVKLLDPDVMCLGNHEFDEGIEGLKEYLQDAHPPLVCANADFSKEPGLKPHIKPSIILEVAGIKVGVIGFIHKNTGVLSPAGNVTFMAEDKALLYEINKLKKLGIRVIIGLGHAGVEIDKTLAAGLPDIDVVVGGHTHTYLYTGKGPLPNKVPMDNYPIVVRNSLGHSVPVVHAYAYALFVGKLSVTFDDQGVLKSFSGEPVYMNSEIPPDEEAVKLLKKYAPGIDALKRQILGKSSVYLNGSCRFFECNLGNMVTDSFVHYKAEQFHGPYWSDTSVAIINGGSIRQSISPEPNSDNVTMADVYGSVPFDNILFSIEILGSTLLNAIEHGVSSDGNTSYGEFLQFSGVHVVYDFAQRPFRRVQSLKVRCANCYIPVYEPLSLNKTYKMVLNHYLMTGGDGYGMFQSEAIKITTETINDVDTMKSYMKYYQFFSPRLEERIIIKNDQRTIILFNAGFKIVSNTYTMVLSVFTSFCCLINKLIIA